ncbi:MAG: hypothetical protein QOE73_1460 [Verrucomicrobiota bacterium]
MTAPSIFRQQLPNNSRHVFSKFLFIDLKNEIALAICWAGALILAFSLGEKESSIPLVDVLRAIEVILAFSLKESLLPLSRWERRTRSASEGKGVGLGEG